MVLVRFFFNLNHKTKTLKLIRLPQFSICTTSLEDNVPIKLLIFFCGPTLAIMKGAYDNICLLLSL